MPGRGNKKTRALKRGERATLAQRSWQTRGSQTRKPLEHRPELERLRARASSRLSPMFGLIRGFVHQCTARTEVHVLIIGLDNAGKTTLLYRLKSGRINSFIPTQRANIEDFVRSP